MKGGESSDKGYRQTEPERERERGRGQEREELLDGVHRVCEDGKETVVGLVGDVDRESEAQREPGPSQVSSAVARASGLA